MSSAIHILTGLAESQIHLYLENGELKAKAPRGSITVEIRKTISENKAALIDYLAINEAGIGTFDPQRYKDFSPEKSGNRYLTSFTQQRLWFLEKLAPGSTEYNMPLLAQVSGVFELDHAERALNIIVERHEPLRTYYEDGPDGPVQIIKKDAVISIDCIDISQHSADQQQGLVDQYIKSELRSTFDLSRDTMLRTKYIKCSNQSGVLLLNTHHIAADGWSMGVMFEEFTALYNDLVKGRLASLRELDCFYHHYAKWQRNFVNQSQFDKSLGFWTELLRDAPATHSFPLDHSRSATPSADGASHEFSISAELTHQIKEFVASLDVTLYQFLHAAFCQLISRYSDSTDIVVGSPVSGRTHPSLNKLIGFFANTLALRMDCGREESVAEYLERAKILHLEALRNQDVPFDVLVSELDIKRSTSYSPVFQILFNMNFYHEDKVDVNNVAFTQIKINPGVTKFELSLDAIENKENLVFTFEYRTELFEDSSIRSLAETFVYFLQQLIVDPHAKIRGVQLLPPSHRRRLIKDRNLTSKAFADQASLHQLFEDQAAKTPYDIALEFDDILIDYRSLERDANRLARYLCTDASLQGESIGICMERSPEMVISILAILKAGAAYIPMDPSFPTDRLKFMARDAGMKIILCHSETHECAKVLELNSCINLTEIDGELSCLDSGALNLAQSPSHEALAYIIYTSGSTGQPKGVMCTHQGAVNRIQWMHSKYHLSAGDKVLQKTPYTFDVSVWEFFWPLLYGGTLVIAAPGGHKDSTYLSRVIQEKKINKIHFVPSMLAALLKDKAIAKACFQSSSIQQVFCSGEALTKSTVRDFFECGTYSELHNLYGPTEASVDVSYWQCQQDCQWSDIPIGRPIDNTQLYIVDSNGELSPDGGIGELCIGGVGLAAGYLNRPELTREKFIENSFCSTEGARLYKTGDLARWLPSGHIAYLGRMDGQVKLRGLRVEIGEVETALAALATVQEAAVVVDTDKQILRGFVTFEAGTDQDERKIESLRQKLYSVLPDYMVPSTIHGLEQLPLSANGKLNRKALLALDLRLGHGSTNTYVAPGSELEKQLCRLWSEELDLEKVGVCDDYFMLGGNSIQILSLVQRISVELRATVTIKDIIRHSTIRQLAANIKNLETVSDIELRDTGLGLIRNKVEELKQLNDARSWFSDDKEDIFPASKIQQSMVYLAQTRHYDPIYHDQFPFFVRWKNFNWDRFQEVISILTKKHAILRTTIDIQHNEEPLQVIHKHLDMRVHFEDLSNSNGTSQQSTIERYCAKDLLEKFMRGNEPLWRLVVFKLSPEDFCMVLSFQHAILDGWSVITLCQELVALYELLDSGEQIGEKVHVPLRSTYKDYLAVSLARVLESSSIEFWQTYLRGASRTRLPFNYNSHPVSARSGMLLVQRQLDKPFVAKLSLVAMQLRCTVKELLFAVHLYMLALTTGEKDIITGLVTHDRPALPDGEKILGCFLNTLPLRIQIEKKQSLLDFLPRVKEQVFLVQQNSLFLADIVDATNEQFNSSINPYFDTLFNFVDYPIIDESSLLNVVKKRTGVDIQGAEMTNTYFDVEAHKYGDLLLNLQFKYCPKYFDRSEVETALDLYLSILDVILTGGEQLSPQLVTNTDYLEYYSTFNNTERVYARDLPLHRLFEKQTVLTPDACALIKGEDEISYQELNNRANSIAAGLSIAGVSCGDFVGLKTARSFDMVASIFALLKLGAIYVPIDPSYPLARQQDIASYACLSALLTDDPSVSWHDNTLLIDALPQSSADIREFDEVDPESLAYVIYTSGSTGKPKGVKIAHHSVVNLLSCINREFQVTASDRVLCLSSLGFDLSVYDIFGLLAVGGSVVLADADDARSPDKLCQMIADHKVSLWNTVPSTMSNLVTYLEHSDTTLDLSSLRVALLSGDWIPVSLPEHAHKALPSMQVISLGGATEATVWSNMYPINPKLLEGRISVPYGRPIDNNRFYILDSDLNPVPKGVPGELYIGGVGLAHGYHNDPEKTDAAFSSDPFAVGVRYLHTGNMYRTGDLGRMLPDDNMEFLGRIDTQVKLRGFRIELGEIEAVMRKHTAIKDALAVIHQQDAFSSETQQLVAYFISDEAPERAFALLKAWLEQHLPTYMVPSIYVPITEVPLSANGKVDRRSLPSPSLGFSQTNTYEPLNTKTEKQIAEIWQKYLIVERFGRHDGFFEHGGNSLIATRLINDLRQTFQFDFPINVLFEHTSIAKLAEYIDQIILLKSQLKSASLQNQGAEKWEI